MNQYRLKKILRYYPSTGVFRWLCTHGGVRKGSVAGYKNDKGYTVIRYKGKNYYAHRLVWLYMYNKRPEIIDHINLDKSDNRLCNLRECTQNQNQFNFLPRNKLGVKGVDKRGNRYQAKITYHKKCYHLGMFGTLEDASQAYQNVAKILHGEFYRHGT